MASVPKHSTPHPHAIVLIDDPALPRQVQIDLLQCCHCQRMWQVQPGSGRKRGFCLRCHQVTCGAPQCEECVPFEQKLDRYEAGKVSSLM